eukprot:TRINITY_DN1757_c0_g1_i2.p1 TRINITY_DN1757_c0_g1~~TRINITY_DN1757_c0_g1_i2.p1  ORF type:complete len:173 (-),score=3.13 TRINITY_DN1757_c0_g1_i2:34-552(-)
MSNIQAVIKDSSMLLSQPDRDEPVYCCGCSLEKLIKVIQGLFLVIQGILAVWAVIVIFNFSATHPVLVVPSVLFSLACCILSLLILVRNQSRPTFFLFLGLQWGLCLARFGMMLGTTVVVMNSGDCYDWCSTYFVLILGDAIALPFCVILLGVLTGYVYKSQKFLNESMSGL